MQTPRTLAALSALSLGFAGLTGCASSEYGMSVVSFPGSRGAELSDDQTRVSTGVGDMICTVEQQDTEDIWVDEWTRDVTVVDLLNDGTALILDAEGSVSVVDPGDWDIAPSEPGYGTDIVVDGRGNTGVDDAQFLGEQIVTLTGCRLQGAGLELKLPEPCKGASLHEGAGTLVVWHADGTVYEATPSGLVAWTVASDLAWDGRNRTYLALDPAGTSVSGWSGGSQRWQTELPFPAIDVFPFESEVGLRDADGFLWRLDPRGRDLTEVGTSIGTDGNVVGSAGPGTIALFTDGLYVLPIR
jgi:hypothetical protein